MNISKRSAILLTGLGLIGGVAGTIGLQTHAQTSTSTNSTSSTAQTTHSRPMGHAPLGGDGNVTAINGTNITMQEETDEGGASYTIDASKATVTNNGATATLSDIKVGDKIFVQGTTSGTNVSATSVSLGHPGMGGRGMWHQEAPNSNSTLNN